MKLLQSKSTVLLLIALFYVFLGIGFRLLFLNGYVSAIPLDVPERALDYAEVSEHLLSAQDYVENNLVRYDGHVYLYQAIGDNVPLDNIRATNSEAMSYYLLWSAQSGDKRSFDLALRFIERNMLHEEGFMMWRVEESGAVVSDGVNIASDADLRAIKALLIAEQQWGDDKYSLMIETLAEGIELVAINDDALLAPYGGIAGDPWVGEEVWLSYEDFVVFKELSDRYGEPWTSVYVRMKELTIRSQTPVGLYNSEVTQSGGFAHDIDGPGYSINSMWMLVRAAESDDPELRSSARKGLDFYKARYAQEQKLFTLYSSNGDPLTSAEAPWVYALVGRAAAELNDNIFADKMIQELLSFQVNETSSELYGAIPEGAGDSLRVGQFTMQESILTLQAYQETLVSNPSS